MRVTILQVEMQKHQSQRTANIVISHSARMCLIDVERGSQSQLTSMAMGFIYTADRFEGNCSALVLPDKTRARQRLLIGVGGVGELADIAG